MTWKRTLDQLAKPASGRVAPVFKPYHAAVALVMIGREQPLGRYELCQNMSIGEGSVRTLLRRFTEAGLIMADGKQGQRLTSRGQRLFKDILKDIPMGLFLDLGSLAIYPHTYANLVRGRAGLVRDGIRQRDEAIVQGGREHAGATTLVMKNGLLLMPPDDHNVLLTSEREATLILESLRPQDGDVIVIGASDDRNLAREVAMAAALTLFEDE